MTVWYEEGRGYRYDFWLFNVRHTSPRGFDTEREAEDAESELRRRLRRQAAGLEPRDRPPSPKFIETAGAYLQFVIDRNRVKDPDTVDRVQRVILRFFGPKPIDADKVKAGEPYHDLRLQDVIDHPSWLLKFEDWMTKRGIEGATKNRYRSAASRLYWFAMLPERREESGITSNPFRGILRDEEHGRDVTLSIDEVRAIMRHATFHLRLTIVIAALAPKLRLGNILALRWDRNFDKDLTMITVHDHKTQKKTRRPMKSIIVAQLRQILEGAKARQPKKVPWVIHYRRDRLTRVDIGLAKACADAGVTYGRANGGATFHTIRHSAATMLAALGVPDGLRKDVMGQRSFQTTHGYTHLQPIHERGPLEQLSEAFPLADLVTAPRLVGGGTTGGTGRKTRGGKRPMKAIRKTKPSPSKKR